MTIQVHDTLTGQKRELVPLVPGKLGVYVCGPTVYDLAHLGHARCYVVWDVAVRHLRARGFEVKFVRNITDVDDKIIARARERGEAETLFNYPTFSDMYRHAALVALSQQPQGSPASSPDLPGT